ncbi:unnamed protein product [Blepharisma stoltei]|uniref:Uncharacterized protein n=1 Tax=Blepharisma stoltei TaxID=1481888 RepID=A0AAU9K6B1_9CILI|nr:unnamed protein product [Blepharisma stoltei]
MRNAIKLPTPISPSSSFIPPKLDDGDSTPRLYDLDFCPTISQFNDSQACYVFSPLSRSIKLENLGQTDRKMLSELNGSQKSTFSETQINSSLKLGIKEKAKYEKKIEDLENEIKALKRMKVLLREKDRIVGNIESQLDIVKAENQNLKREVKNLRLENLALTNKFQSKSEEETKKTSEDPVVRVSNALNTFKSDLTDFILLSQRKRSKTEAPKPARL